MRYYLTVPPELGSGAQAQNLLGGEWKKTTTLREIINPLTAQPMLSVPNPELPEASLFAESLEKVPRYGLHNPKYNVERYLMLGDVCARAADELRDPVVYGYFAKLIQTVMPKSFKQCLGEVTITQKFLENFCGDRVRYLANGQASPGDHDGQEPRSYNWPYGGVVVIAPFNFPLEIPALQVLGALFMGNHPLVKVDSKVSIVFEQFLRLLIRCGLPPTDVDLIHCRAEVMGQLVNHASKHIRILQFTGSTRVAEELSRLVNGRIRIEDGGFNFRIVGPDVPRENLRYLTWQSDQDAYAASGQKCSAESFLILPKNIAKDFLKYRHELAARRNLGDLTVGPVLSLTTSNLKWMIKKLTQLPGATILWGGQPLEGHSIPEQYGAIQPTMIQLPIKSILENLDLVATEIFGPVEITTTYDNDSDLHLLVSVLQKLPHHLTAAIVSNDPTFQRFVLSRTLNGTTYVGLLARTTGAPQNHFFGPGGDPRAAGIGTDKAIVACWSCHREIIEDQSEIPHNWEIPEAS